MVIVFSNCQIEKKKNISANTKPFHELIGSIVNAKESVEGIILHIESPELNISWTGVAGNDPIGVNLKLRTDQPFRIDCVPKWTCPKSGLSTRNLDCLC